MCCELYHKCECEIKDPPFIELKLDFSGKWRVEDKENDESNSNPN